MTSQQIKRANDKADKESKKQIEKEEKKRSVSKSKETDLKDNPAHKPKKFMSAYTHFNTKYTAENRAKEKAGELKLEYNESHFGLAGKKWKTMTDKEKEPYEKLAREDKERHQRQEEELKKKGYFTLEDGTKSTAAQNSHLWKEKRPKKQKKGAMDKS